MDPMAIFVEAMDNLKPLIGVAGVKKGGATYKVTPTLLALLLLASRDLHSLSFSGSCASLRVGAPNHLSLTLFSVFSHL